jgi:hypothetical protein
MYCSGGLEEKHKNILKMALENQLNVKFHGALKRSTD